MIDRTIAIRNVYVMMAYAFGAMRGESATQVSTESFDHLHDLLAEILVRGVGAQVKRGLHHDYATRSEELTTVRGRIDVTRTAAQRSTTRGRLACVFDEYLPDTPHNQALKAVIILLIRHGSVARTRRDALRRLLPYLDAVTSVSAGAIRWRRLTYHRANSAYRLLLGVCELVIRGLLPREDPGDMRLGSWFNEDAMSSLYERFIRQYYAVHHAQLSPGARIVAWDLDPGSESVGQLPQMRTDVSLRHGDRMLIIDAKYYKDATQTGPYGKATARSAHLYQILAYVKNADVHRNGSVSGLLLYARTDAEVQPDVDVVIQGNRVGARTLDLNRPWEDLAGQLEQLVTWLDV